METLSSTKEGQVAKAIESQTAKIPSDYSLWFGLGVLGASFLLQTTKFKHIGLALGQAAAPILIMGLYNKIVKTQGHDQQTNRPERISNQKSYTPDLG